MYDLDNAELARLTVPAENGLAYLFVSFFSTNGPGKYATEANKVGIEHVHASIDVP